MLSRFLPGYCFLCRARSQRSRDLCVYCEHDLPYLGSHCLRCALPLPNSQHPLICGHCLRQSTVIDRTIALFRYDSPLPQWLYSIKFRHHMGYLTVLGELLASHLNQILSPSEYPEMIIPMPLHPHRQQKRGFNQAMELAKFIGKIINIPVENHYCHRIRDTEQQSQLPFEERKRNLRSAFRVDTRLCTKSVAIVDDVVTTGATVRSLAKALRTQGVSQISVWCAARTLLSR